MQVRQTEVHIDSWQDFRDAMPGGTSRVPLPTIWRGQRDSSWPLRSSFDRLYVKFEDYAAQQLPNSRLDKDTEAAAKCYREMRDGYLRAFKRFASGMRGPAPAPLDSDQWWALGRHFGLRTPLLDWSDKPFVALFFAVSGLLREMKRNAGDIGAIEFSGKSCAVYRIMICDPIESLSAEGFRIIRPRCEELSRMHSQHGLFTLTDSFLHRDLESFLSDKHALPYLTKFVIPDKVAMEAYRDLHNFGIDWKLLYPDLTGAALAANDVCEIPDDLWDLRF